MRRWEGLPRGISATKDTNYCSTVDCDLLQTPMNVYVHVCVCMKQVWQFICHLETKHKSQTLFAVCLHGIPIHTLVPRSC